VIRKQDVMPLLLAACPGFAPMWRAHLEYWEGEERGIFNDTGEFARYLVESYAKRQTDDLGAAFTTLERIIREGDDEARGAATVGVLESVQTLASHEPSGPSVFLKWLGPLSRRAWTEIEAQWEAGGGSLAGVIRNELRSEARPLSAVLVTPRLSLRRLSEDDAEFILELVNEPAWIRFIGDRRVQTRDDARAYIRNGPIASYERFGFGLWLTGLREGSVPVGICGLLKRDWLEDVDVGFAFLERFRGKGYARESVKAVLAHGRAAFGLQRIAAITDPANVASIRVLEAVGMRFERCVTADDGGPTLSLYVV
jgi:[ribosomal protein S5]-alanine N-acetyltransferase